MPADKSGKEGFRETGKNVELSCSAGGLEILTTLGEELGRLDVCSESVTLANHCTGQLYTEAVLVLSEFNELVRVEVDTGSSAAESSMTYKGRLTGSCIS